MKNTVDSLEKLVHSFTTLGGVGQKTARRYAYSVLDMHISEVEEFAKNMTDAKKKIRFCSVCGGLSDQNVCEICKNRKSDIVTVVASVKDIEALERVKNFNTLYHVLHGTISPMQSRGPEHLKIKELLNRLGDGEIKEIILATNPDIEGEATAMYLTKLIKPLGVKVSRLAQGVSMGSELEFADEITLGKALTDRREL